MWWWEGQTLRGQGRAVDRYVTQYLEHRLCMSSSVPTCEALVHFDLVFGPWEALESGIEVHGSEAWVGISLATFAFWLGHPTKCSSAL